MRLKLDGSVEVRVTMAGVVLSLFHDPGGATEREGPFNRRVHTYVNAPLHDHLSNWKVDIDVAGTNNSFLKESVRSGSYEVRRMLLADLWRQQVPLGSCSTARRWRRLPLRRTWASAQCSSGPPPPLIPTTCRRRWSRRASKAGGPPGRQTTR